MLNFGWDPCYAITYGFKYTREPVWKDLKIVHASRYTWLYRATPNTKRKISSTKNRSYESRGVDFIASLASSDVTVFTRGLFLRAPQYERKNRGVDSDG